MQNMYVCISRYADGQIWRAPLGSEEWVQVWKFGSLHARAGLSSPTLARPRHWPQSHPHLNTFTSGWGGRRLGPLLGVGGFGGQPLGKVTLTMHRMLTNWPQVLTRLTNWLQHFRLAKIVLKHLRRYHSLRSPQCGKWLVPELIEHLNS